MGWWTAKLFSRVQAAGFYEDLHRRAVQLLPPSDGRHVWVDMGCGPGLVTRLAAAHGYHATGVDIDPAMIRQARRSVAGFVPQGGPAVEFMQGGLDMLGRLMYADVVSAASLLAVLPDRPAALYQLLASLGPDGALLLIEPDIRFTPSNATAYRRRYHLGADAWVLWLWAATRTPWRAVQLADVTVEGWITTRYPLLDGMVNAWILRRA